MSEFVEDMEMYSLTSDTNGRDVVLHVTRREAMRMLQVDELASFVWKLSAELRNKRKYKTEKDGVNTWDKFEEWFYKMASESEIDLEWWCS